jgi:hypothetical protein
MPLRLKNSHVRHILIIYGWQLKTAMVGSTPKAQNPYLISLNIDQVIQNLKWETTDPTEVWQLAKNADTKVYRLAKWDSNL